MQVLLLLYVVGMQIIATVLNMVIPVVYNAVVGLAVRGILVDIETTHPLTLEEEGVLVEHLVEV